MDGVIILAVEQVASAWTFNWWAFAIAIVATALFSLLLGYLYEILDEALYYAMFGFLSIAAGVIAGFVWHTPTEYETQYKVTMTNDVPVTEFYEHYEVIEQEGLIFTVKEKTDEGNRSN